MKIFDRAINLKRSDSVHISKQSITKGTAAAAAAAAADADAGSLAWSAVAVAVTSYYVQ